MSLFSLNLSFKILDLVFYYQPVMANGKLILAHEWSGGIQAAPEMYQFLSSYDIKNGHQETIGEVCLEGPGYDYEFYPSLPTVLDDGSLLVALHYHNNYLKVIRISPENEVISEDRIGWRAEENKQFQRDIVSNDLANKLWVELLYPVDKDTYIITWQYRSQNFHTELRHFGDKDPVWYLPERFLSLAGNDLLCVLPNDRFTMREADSLNGIWSFSEPDSFFVAQEGRVLFFISFAEGSFFIKAINATDGKTLWYWEGTGKLTSYLYNAGFLFYSYSQGKEVILAYLNKEGNQKVIRRSDQKINLAQINAQTVLWSEGSLLRSALLTEGFPEQWRIVLPNPCLQNTFILKEKNFGKCNAKLIGDYLILSNQDTVWVYTSNR